MPCYQSHYDPATVEFIKEQYSELGYGVLLLHLDTTDNTALTVYFDNKALKNKHYLAQQGYSMHHHPQWHHLLRWHRC